MTHKESKTTPKPYYAELGRNGTEDEITICSPHGKTLAFIWFWDDEDEDEPDPEAAAAKASARLIVDALNAFDPTGEKCRGCHATMPGMIVIGETEMKE